MKKLSLGAGPRKIEGFTNVDALEWSGNTDIVHDLTNYPYPFREDEIEEISMVEVLEHISFRHTINVLRECHRILKPGGKFKVQVPDCGKAMEYYVNGQVCECVPHKAKSWDEFGPDKECWNCGGKGKINPVRWLYSFTGAQKHEFDAHLNMFTKDSLEKALRDVGFDDLDFQDNVFKLIVTSKKKLL